MPHRGPTAEARGLIVSQIIFSIGFYAIIPFLVVVLRDGYGQYAAAVRVIPGARTFAQQGLFVAGGLLADRFGARAMLFLGCWMRVLGFLLILVARGFWSLLPGDSGRCCAAPSSSVWPAQRWGRCSGCGSWDVAWVSTTRIAFSAEGQST